MNKYVFCILRQPFFMFNVIKIKYNLTKKNVYDIFNMKLCIKEIFDVKRLLKLFLITFIFSYILVTHMVVGQVKL